MDATPIVIEAEALVPQSLITSWGLSLYAKPPQRKGAPEREMLKPVEEWTLDYLLNLNEPTYVDPEDTFDYGLHFWTLLNDIQLAA